MESGSTTVVSTINTMVSGIASDALGIITTNVPVIAPVIAGVLILGFGIRFAKKFVK